MWEYMYQFDLVEMKCVKSVDLESLVRNIPDEEEETT